MAFCSDKDKYENMGSKDVGIGCLMCLRLWRALVVIFTLYSVVLMAGVCVGVELLWVLLVKRLWG